jgi:4-amino-4-deoxy-L-arabinose transferase-like glycosyltransferase
MAVVCETAPVVSPLPHIPRRRQAGPVLLLLMWSGILFFYGLNAGELYQTEGLRALLGGEVLRGGGWAVPSLYGEPLLTKPPGMYVAIAVASWPVGKVTAVTARLPSALAATAAVLLIYAAFARCLGRRAALVAGALMPVSLLWLGRVPSAEIDMLQLAWVAGAVCCFLRGLEISEAPNAGQRRWSEWLWWQIALLCVAGGVLTKWTAPAFFYLTIVPLLAWRRRLRLLVGRAHLLSAALAGGLCLGWAAAAVSVAGWDAFRDTVLREALHRLSPAHHGRPYPWAEVLTFPAELLLANLPVAAVALLTLRPGFSRLWDERGRRLLQTLHCWTWVNLVFWSFVPGHKVRHALPLQPGLAGLAALVWVAWLTGRLRWPFSGVQQLLCRTDLQSVRQEDGLQIRPTDLCLEGSLAGRLGRTSGWCGRPAVVLVALLACWLVVKLAFVHAFVPGRNPAGQPREKADQIAACVPDGRTLYLFRLKDEGILFYYGRPARRLPALAWLPQTGEPVYCLLVQDEWRKWAGRPAEVLLNLSDEQGAPVVLVKVH